MIIEQLTEMSQIANYKRTLGIITKKLVIITKILMMITKRKKNQLMNMIPQMTQIMTRRKQQECANDGSQRKRMKNITEYSMNISIYLTCLVIIVRTPSNRWMKYDHIIKPNIIFPEDISNAWKVDESFSIVAMLCSGLNVTYIQINSSIRLY